MYTQGPSGHPYWLKTNCSQPHAAVRFRHAAIWEACELSSKGALSSKNCELSCSENEFETDEPEPPMSPFSEMFELTPVNVPVALVMRPDTTAE